MIRVGIDSAPGNIGYCAPIFPDNCFEYIPIPKFDNAPGEELTYGNIPARNRKYARFLSDLMHTDLHLFCDKNGVPFIFAVDENGQPLVANDLVPHFDPEFETNTFGDKRTTNGGRIPMELYVGDFVFFYAGLAKYDSAICEFERRWHDIRAAQRYNKCAFLIGYLEIEKIFDIRTKEDLSRNSSEIENNAHYKEGFIGSVIIKGKNNSKLLDKAMQLNYWDNEARKYNPTELGKLIGLRPVSGMRIMKWLGKNVCEELLQTASKVS